MQQRGGLGELEETARGLPEPGEAAVWTAVWGPAPASLGRFAGIVC